MDNLSAFLLETTFEGTEEEIYDIVISGLRARVRECTITWDEHLQLMEKLMESFGESEGDTIGLSRDILAAAARHLCAADSWDFASSTPSSATIASHSALLPHWVDEARPRCHNWAPLPQPMPVEKIILHLFSGRRRRGDLQCYLAQFHDTDHHGPIVTVSVDIVCDLVWGDVTRPDTRAFWIEAIKKGWVCAATAGPPCETWTVARHRHDIEACGPRPVRSHDDLWGFESMRLSEARQVLVGNELLAFSIETFLAMWMVKVSLALSAANQLACLI